MEIHLEDGSPLQLSSYQLKEVIVDQQRVGHVSLVSGETFDIPEEQIRLMCLGMQAERPGSSEHHLWVEGKFRNHYGDPYFYDSYAFD